MWRLIGLFVAIPICVASASGVSFGETRKPLEVLWDKTFGGAKGDFAMSIAALPDGGLAVAGSTQSKGAGGTYAWVLRLDSTGRMLWDKTLGGSDWDEARSIAALPDGGLAVAGFTGSKGAGQLDVWVLRLDRTGRVLWDKTFGGPKHDQARSIVALPDGGFAVAGFTGSKGAGEFDAWVLRLDRTGRKLWDKTLGGPKNDLASSIVALADGGFAVAGATESKGAGAGDAWVLRLDRTGRILWDKTFGGAKSEWARSVIALADGGFAVAGSTGSKGAGADDIWVLRLDRTGRILWDKTFGGPEHDQARSIVALADGGFAVAGSTESKGAGSRDAWVLRLDSAGRMLWDKVIGGPNGDEARSVVALADGGLAMAGSNGSKGAGRGDFWVLRLGRVSAK